MNLIAVDHGLLIIFVLNTLLVLLDATAGYHLAPRLLRMSGTDDDEAQTATLRTVRRLLTGLVALYMFINCLGYFRGNCILMMVVAGMIAVDLGLQFYMCRRAAHDEDQQ